MTGQIRIRPYADRDLPAVRALFIAVNEELAPAHLRDAFDRYVARSLREEIDCIPDYYAARGGSFWIAEDSGALLGMFGLEGAGHGAVEIRRMYVAPRARRRGIARALLAHAESIAQAAGCERIVLSTSELQGAALALYRAAGYRLVREEVALAESNKTVGSGLRRYHFVKDLATS
jgi:ribosomal protein S18 acetylase RimI-like enzyme